MRVPAVPFHEHRIREIVRMICDEYQLKYTTDTFGNLLIEHKRGKLKRPMAMVAHLDHPGFEVLHKRSARRLEAEFLGVRRLGCVPGPDRRFDDAVTMGVLGRLVGLRLVASTSDVYCADVRSVCRYWSTPRTKDRGLKL